MESRMVKFYSKESNMVAIHAIPGHFATSHSHINYYIDITSLKTRIQEAKEVARVLHQKIGRVSYVDTIVCMDGTEVIGAFLAEEFEKEDMASTNRHETIYVVSPEMNSNNQLLFRDNIKPSIAGKHVILLSASTTTGKTIHRSLEGIRYYGGGVGGGGLRQWPLCSARYLRWMDLRYTRCSMQRIFRDMRLIPQMTVHSVKKESSWMPWSMDSVILSYDQK